MVDEAGFVETPAIKNITPKMANWGSALNISTQRIEDGLGGPMVLGGYRAVVDLPPAADFQDCLATIKSGSSIALYLSDGEVWKNYSDGFTEQEVEVMHIEDVGVQYEDLQDNDEWHDRIITDLTKDETQEASIDTDNYTITLPAGTWYVDLRMAFGNTDGHTARIIDDSDDSLLLQGVAWFAEATGEVTDSRMSGGWSYTSGKFTLADETTIRIQAIFSTYLGAFGTFPTQGIATGFGDNEIYLHAKFMRRLT